MLTCLFEILYILWYLLITIERERKVFLCLLMLSCLFENLYYCCISGVRCLFNFNGQREDDATVLVDAHLSFRNIIFMHFRSQMSFNFSRPREEDVAVLTDAHLSFRNLIFMHFRSQISFNFSRFERKMLLC